MQKVEFYKSAEWKKLRFRVIHKSTYCALCYALLDKHGKNKIHVDHIIRRAERPDLSLDIRNVRALCTTCHMSTKQKIDNGGKENEAIGIDGWRINGS